MLAKRRRELLHLAREVDCRHFLAHDCRAEVLGLLLHRPGKLKAIGTLGKPRVILDPLGLRKLSTRGNPFEYGNGKPGTRGIKTCGEPRGTCADNRHIEYVVFHHGHPFARDLIPRQQRCISNTRRRREEHIAPQRLPNLFQRTVYANSASTFCFGCAPTIWRFGAPPSNRISVGTLMTP